MTFDEQGWALIPDVISANQRTELMACLGSVSGAGRRGLLAEPQVAALARSEPLLKLVRPFLPQEPRPVRGIYFDKSPAENWLVAWHQDLTIAVDTRLEVAGFGPWSLKDEIPHVQPPAERLAQMITLRLHLDDADETNGALRVLPGSHRHGRLSPSAIHDLRESGTEVLCSAKAGDALLMRPLILHASGRSTSSRHRRILHLEYAGFDLPHGLRWCEH